MLPGPIKLVFRNLLRSRIFSVVNVLGLSLALAGGLMVFLWVRDEYGMDAFHKDAPRLYAVYERVVSGRSAEAGYATQGLLAEALKRQIPEIRYAAALDYAAMPGTQNAFEAGNKVAKMTGKYAGPDFFRMFSYPLLEGSPETALEQPGGIAISRRMAERFFGSTAAAMGKSIRFDDREALQVTAVFENIPAHSSEQFDFLRSWKDYVTQNPWVNNWGSASPETFIELRAGADPGAVEKKIKDFVYRYRQPDQASRTELGLIPYSQRYLYGRFENGRPSGGRIIYVRLFCWIGIFLLLIASVNFMNLATARYMKRAKEVGLRKVIGASRTRLVLQFLGEAVTLAFIALALALILAKVALPAFNQLTARQLSLPLGSAGFWAAAGLLTALTGLVAGIVPALLLSSLRPMQAFSGRVAAGISMAFLRKTLVVFQFTLSVLFIIGVLVISRQMDYVRTRDLGYRRDNLLSIPIEGRLSASYALFKDRALAVPGILAVSKMRNTPTYIEHHTDGVRWTGMDPGRRIDFADVVVGYDFEKTMGLTMVQGRGFSRDFGGDSTGFLLNETAVREMGLKDPVGTMLHWNGRTGSVIGVVKDFNFTSLHEKIEPLIARLDDQWTWGTILVRISGKAIPREIAGLQRICRSLNPAFAFSYSFVDADYDQLYRSDETVGRLAAAFSLLAVLISCMGLLGLAAFTAEKRTQEIGVRKVLGASAAQIALLLSKDFLKWVILAIVIASPLGWWASHRWLESFAYHVGVHADVFILAAGIALAVAAVTVSTQAIAAAVVNPVRSLRSE